MSRPARRRRGRRRRGVALGPSPAWRFRAPAPGPRGGRCARDARGDRGARIRASHGLRAGARRRGRSSFPDDHGPHPEFRTEWWYYTGNLETRGGPSLRLPAHVLPDRAGAAGPASRARLRLGGAPALPRPLRGDRHRGRALLARRAARAAARSALAGAARGRSASGSRTGRPRATARETRFPVAPARPPTATSPSTSSLETRQARRAPGRARAGAARARSPATRRTTTRSRACRRAAPCTPGRDIARGRPASPGWTASGARARSARDLVGLGLVRAPARRRARPDALPAAPPRRHRRPAQRRGRSSPPTARTRRLARRRTSTLEVLRSLDEPGEPACAIPRAGGSRVPVGRPRARDHAAARRPGAERRASATGKARCRAGGQAGRSRSPAAATSSWSATASSVLQPVEAHGAAGHDLALGLRRQPPAARAIMSGAPGKKPSGCG